jgi:serine/threonine-protein kinase
MAARTTREVAIQTGAFRETRPMPVGARGGLTDPWGVFRVDRRPQARADEPPTTTRYTALRPLGTGGGSTVWLVLDRLLRRHVAMKVMRAVEADDPAARERFLFEMRVAASLDDPGVMDVLDTGVLEDGRCLYTMRHAEGGSLADRLAAERVGGLDRQLIPAYIGLCRTAGRVHAQSILHCDLKPANVMLDRGGHALLVDFGAAWRVGDGMAGSGRRLHLPGTVAYMAPERHEEDARVLGTWTDVFSLGVVLYELATGRRPFDGPTPMAVALEVCAGEPPDPRTFAPDMPAELADGCMAALARDPTRRTRSPGVLAELAVDALLAGWQRVVGRDRPEIQTAHPQVRVVVPVGTPAAQRIAQ